MTDEQAFCLPLRARVYKVDDQYPLFKKLSDVHAVTTSDLIINDSLDNDKCETENQQKIEYYPVVSNKTKGKQQQNPQNNYCLKSRSLETGLEMRLNNREIIKEELAEQLQNEHQAHFEEFSLIENLQKTHIHPTQMPSFISSFKEFAKQRDTLVSEDISVLKFSFMEEEEDTCNNE